MGNNTIVISKILSNSEKYYPTPKNTINEERESATFREPRSQNSNSRLIIGRIHSVEAYTPVHGRDRDDRSKSRGSMPPRALAELILWLLAKKYSRVLVLVFFGEKY